MSSCGAAGLPAKIESMSAFRRFLKDEQGQDLVEYTLLVAFVCLASAAIFIDTGGSMSGIWGAASTQLTSADALAS